MRVMRRIFAAGMACILLLQSAAALARTEGQHESAWKEIASSFVNSLAVKHDGTVWYWGSHFTNEGKETDTVLRPTLVEGLSDVVSVAAGANHALALRKDGTVWAWGY
jgi:alpha-tubulin suppressor-like RCC1 family protein